MIDREYFLGEILGVLIWKIILIVMFSVYIVGFGIIVIKEKVNFVKSLLFWFIVKNYEMNMFWKVVLVENEYFMVGWVDVVYIEIVEEY